MTNPLFDRESLDTLDILSKVLMRCWLLGFALLALWAGLVLLGRDFVYRVHGNMFGLAEHELDLIFYAAMVLTKVMVLVFFFIPWVAVRLVLKTT
jgi:hypothetical protein